MSSTLLPVHFNIKNTISLKNTDKRLTNSNFPALFQPVFSLLFIHTSEGVPRAFRGPFEGLRRAFGGVNLSEPPRNPLKTPCKHKTEACRINWRDYLKKHCREFHFKIIKTSHSLNITPCFPGLNGLSRNLSLE